MRPSRLTSGTILIPLVGLGIPMLGSLVAALAFPEQHWPYQPLHIVIEGLGAVIAVALSLLVLILRRYRDVPPYQHWIACALLGMGVLDGLHALSGPGESFVWLRSIATLVGGFFFALIWLPDRVVRSTRGWVVPGMVAGGALALGLVSILFPDIVPTMVVQGSFTPAARTLNILGGLFFLVAATKLAGLYRISGGGNEFLFAIPCTLFGAAGLLFDSSELWDAGWWWWHLVRLTAYCVVLRYMVTTYRRTKEVVSPYALLPTLIIVITVLALVIGAIALRYVEARLVAMTGESLVLASAEIADKLDRVLFERYGDVQMMARAFGLRPHGRRELTAYLNWMRTTYRMYLWMGVTDGQGRVVAATDRASVGLDKSHTDWFRAVRDGRVVHVGDVEVSEESNGQDALEFSAPIIGPRGEFLGAISTRAGLPELENVVTQTIRTVEAQQEFLGTVEYQFLTRTGDVFIDSDLAHKGNVNLKRIGLPSALLIESVQPGYVEEEHLRRHVAVVTGYARTKGDVGLLWGVLIRRDRSDILAPIRQVLLKLSAAGAVVWLPMLGLLFWATRRVRIEYVKARRESAHARAAEATLREQNERFELVGQATNDWILDWNVVTNEVWWNDSLEVLFGYNSRDIRPSFEFWYERIHPDDRERVVASKRAVLKEGRRFWSGEYRFRRADGSYAEVIDRAYALYDEQGKALRMIGSIRDITQSKQAEKRQAAQLAVSLVLVESGTLADAAPKLLQAVCDTTGWELAAIWRVDRVANVLRCETMWHVPAVNVEEFVTLSRERTFTLGVGLPGRVWESSQPAWIPDVVKDPNFPRAPVAAKVGLHGACGFPILLGQEVLGVLEFFSSEIRQPDRDLLSMMADIGIKVGQFIERHQLGEQLRQSQKMEAIGQLAGGVAHDFNNLLTVIKGYSQFLLSRVEPDSPLRRDIEEIQKAGDRAADLTRQLLAFSRRQVLVPKVLNLNEVLASTEGMLRRLIGEDVAMVTVLSPSLGLAKADPGQLEQIIVNLAVNARDAMPQGGKLTIETTNVAFNGVHSGKQVTIPPGRYVVLAVSDTGCGMDTATQARIFEPFFTTKEKGKGTGLGLATVYGIVKQSSGYITVYSEPGRGATFKVYLPRVEALAEPAATSRGGTMSLDGSETILLVEDEDTIRTLACGALRSYGYTVLEARGAAEALRLSQERPGQIHLLLTDVVMPQGSGRELAERLASLRPDMKVLYMSGYTDDAVVRHGVLQQGTAFLQKPFTPDVLARKVREVMDAPPQAAPTASSD